VVAPSHQAPLDHEREDENDDAEEEEEDQEEQDAAPAAPPLELSATAAPGGGPVVDPEDPVQNSYEVVKARFELRCCKVLSPFA
jgi:hypothetical protein